MASKIRSSCFLAHVRASSVGNVNTLNCHPFAHDEFLFVHNGTIENFKNIKRELQQRLSDQAFNIIKGQTDSEHFFALTMSILYEKFSVHNTNSMCQALILALKEIVALQEKYNDGAGAKLNIAFTKGHQLIASHFSSKKNKPPPSLHYTLGAHLSSGNPGTAIIASEPIDDYPNEWQKVPNNHLLIINADYTVKTLKID